MKFSQIDSTFCSSHPWFSASSNNYFKLNFLQRWQQIPTYFGIMTCETLRKQMDSGEVSSAASVNLQTENRVVYWCKKLELVYSSFV